MAVKAWVRGCIGRKWQSLFREIIAQPAEVRFGALQLLPDRVVLILDGVGVPLRNAIALLCC